MGLIPALCAPGPSFLVMVTGSPVFWWSGVLLYIAGAIIEAFGRSNRRNPSDEEIEALTNAPFYKWCTWAFVPVYLAGLAIACFMWTDPALTAVDRIGLMVTIGLMGGFAINVSHELGHQKASVERWLSKVATAPSWYAHFYTEHSRGHHTRVATPEDAVSARYGESYWHFLQRSIIGEFRFAIGAERERLGRKGKPFLSANNDILHGWIISAGLYSALIAIFGWGALPYLLGHAVIAMSFLECVNYVEHYGLLREQRPDGRYHRPGPQHSWNSTRAVTGLATFHLQRHSDHHAHPGRRYQLLRIEDEAPELPGGYAQMVLLALVPPLWRRVMDPRVLALYDGDVRRANLTPKLRARHGHAAPVQAARPPRSAARAAAGVDGTVGPRVEPASRTFEQMAEPSELTDTVVIRLRDFAPDHLRETGPINLRAIAALRERDTV